MTRKLIPVETPSSLTPPRKRKQRNRSTSSEQTSRLEQGAASVPSSVVDEAVASPDLKGAATDSRSGKSWNWLWFWMGTLSLLAGTGSAALLLLARVPPSPDCQRLSTLSAPAEQLYCAQQMINSGELVALTEAIGITQQISSEHPFYNEAQKLLGNSSEKLLAIATQRMRQGNLEEALALAKRIPESSPVYQKVQDAIADWTQHWDRGNQISQRIQGAIKVQDWQQATELTRTLSKVKNPHWRNQVGKLTRQIQTERIAWQHLRQAQTIAQANTVTALNKAIELVQQIDRQRHARPEAQAEVARWSRGLLSLAEARIEKNDFQGAIAAAEKVPQSSALYIEAQDLTQLSRAQSAAASKGPLALLEAQAIARRIGTGRPLYRPAQKLIDRWQAELRDRSQLQLAKATASLGQKFSYQLAIQQAQMVEQGRPQRIPAQTLVAGWQKEIQRLEDRPFLVRAQTLSQPGTIASLRSAIAEAQKIVRGRPLRIQAQTLIAEWTKDIEIIEDRPILNRARELAAMGQLRTAIAEAEKIAQGRALYAEAQDEIRDWQWQIQLAMDRAILAQARALADQVYLTQAIRKASEIKPGRPLYGEAQADITEWARQRSEIEARRDQPSRDQPSHNSPSRNQPSRNQPSHNRPSRNQSSPKQSSRNQPSRERGGGRSEGSASSSGR